MQCRRQCGQTIVQWMCMPDTTVRHTSDVACRVPKHTSEHVVPTVSGRVGPCSLICPQNPTMSAVKRARQPSKEKKEYRTKRENIYSSLLYLLLYTSQPTLPDTWRPGSSMSVVHGLFKECFRTAEPKPFVLSTGRKSTNSVQNQMNAAEIYFQLH